MFLYFRWPVENCLCSSSNYASVSLTRIPMLISACCDERNHLEAEERAHLEHCSEIPCEMPTYWALESLQQLIPSQLVSCWQHCYSQMLPSVGIPSVVRDSSSFFHLISKFWWWTHGYWHSRHAQESLTQYWSFLIVTFHLRIPKEFGLSPSRRGLFPRQRYHSCWSSNSSLVIMAACKVECPRWCDPWNRSVTLLQIQNPRFSICCPPSVCWQAWGPDEWLLLPADIGIQPVFGP